MTPLLEEVQVVVADSCWRQPARLLHHAQQQEDCRSAQVLRRTAAAWMISSVAGVATGASAYRPADPASHAVTTSSSGLLFVFPLKTPVGRDKMSVVDGRLIDQLLAGGGGHRSNPESARRPPPIGPSLGRVMTKD